MTTNPSPAEFEQIVARECLREALSYQALDPFFSSDTSAVRFGAFISDIAKASGLSIPQTRRRMRALQAAGQAMRSDTEGGRTRWWLVGLAATQRPTVVQAITPIRQALTTSMPAAGRQHWSNVLGVARDCSTSEARAAFASAVASLDETDPDYPNQRRRVHEAIDACCREHEIQVTE